MKPLILRTFLPLLALLGLAGTGHAQEVRYSWMDMSFMAPDIGRSGTLPSPGIPDQIVDIAASDGSGVRFRGSFATWKNIYLMLDYSSTDIDLSGTVRNTTTGADAPFEDEFDYTSIRGGVGLKYSIFEKTDIFGELTFDSVDFDFGSFAGENFDMDRQEAGGTLGVRTMFGDHFMLQVQGRYSGVGDADLTTGLFDADTLFGAGFSWEIIRGLSIVGDVEAGEFSSWALGFRIDLDED